MTDWRLHFVLPSLRLAHAEEAHAPYEISEVGLKDERIAIVANSDERLQQIVNQSKAADALVNGFVDEQGRAVAPAALIEKIEPESRHRKDLAVYVAFRNALAISFVLMGRARHMVGWGIRFPLWSDTFDFYPTTVDKQGGLSKWAPGITHLAMDPESFCGMPSPDIPVGGKRMVPDYYLLRVLGMLWRATYFSDEDLGSFHRAVFRSLELAYSAAASVSKNQGSLHDYASDIVNWVTAMEILAGADRERVNRSDVRDLAGEYTWDKATLNYRRYRNHFANEIISVNLIQRILYFVYEVRNTFIHGNPLSSKQMAPTVGDEVVSVWQCAPIIYRTVLAAYLERQYGRLSFADDSTGKVIDEIMTRGTYGKALLQEVGR